MWHTCGMAFGWVYKDAAAEAVRVSPWTREEAEEIIGDPMVHYLALKRFGEDIRYGDSPCIDRDYAGEWVGIFERKVVVHEADHAALIQAIKARPDLDIGSVYVRRVTSRTLQP